MIKIKRTRNKTMQPVKPFTSLDEEANFWDAHSVMETIQKGTVVGFHKANKTHTITIRFQPEFLQKLRSKAFEQGLGPTTLARMWIMEHLQHA